MLFLSLARGIRWPRESLKHISDRFPASTQNAALSLTPVMGDGWYKNAAAVGAGGCEVALGVAEAEARRRGGVRKNAGASSSEEGFGEGEVDASSGRATLTATASVAVASEAAAATPLIGEGCGDVDDLFASLGLLDTADDDKCGIADGDESDGGCFGCALGVMDGVDDPLDPKDAPHRGAEPSSAAAAQPSREGRRWSAGRHHRTHKVTPMAIIGGSSGSDDESDAPDWYRDCELATSPPMPSFLPAASERVRQRWLFIFTSKLCCMTTPSETSR